MNIDYKKSVGIIANYIIEHTLLEFPKFNLLAGSISEDEFRKQMSLSPLMKTHHIEEIIITTRGIKSNSEEAKTSYSMTLRFVVTFDHMLESCPDLLKVMDDINGKGVSTHIKKCLK